MVAYKRDWSRKKNGVTEESYRRSATYKGLAGEWLALELLYGSKHMNGEVMNREFDILWNGKRVDVKTCELYKRKLKRGKPAKSSGWWVFNKNKASSDLYFCICLLDGKPLRAYMIPAKEFGGGITIGWNTRHDKYLFRTW